MAKQQSSMMEVEKVENVSQASAAQPAVWEQFSQAERKKVLRKMDIRILPVLMSLYVLSYLDRANIGNAQIEGMSKDLHMTGTQYNILLSVFFATYITFEMPSTFVMEKWFTFRPSLWMAILAIGWGVMMTLHGIVQNFGGIVTLRLIMGAFEAGFFPGAMAFMNKWYTKYELATRFAVFYSGSALAGAFSGLLAFAITKMDGVGGLEGWRWIFIIEGIGTVVAGFTLPWILTDTPDNRPRWLSSSEQDYLIDRMTAQNGGVNAKDSGKHLNSSILLTVISDWQYYVFTLILWSATVPTYGLKFTLPSIVKGMGYTASNAQLLSIPPYIAGAISSIGFNFLSDKFKRRAYFLIIPQTLLVIAYAILTPLSPKSQLHIGPCYFAVVLANIGCYPINPGTSSWVSNNTAGSAKRSVGLAYLISLSNVGGIFASYIFVASEAPGYPSGFGTSLAFAAVGIIAVLGLEFTYVKINKKREALCAAADDDGKAVGGINSEQLVDLGDKSPTFRYTL